VRRWCLSADRLVAAAICEKAKESNLTEALRQCGPLLREFHSSATSISARLPFCVERLVRRSNSAPSFEPCRSSIDWLRDLLLAEQRSFRSRIVPCGRAIPQARTKNPGPTDHLRISRHCGLVDSRDRRVSLVSNQDCQARPRRSPVMSTADWVIEMTRHTWSGDQS
jgi:hypothetical protein